MSKQTIGQQVMEWIKVFVVALVIALFISKVLIVNATIPSASMSTTIEVGDRLFANRLAYLRSEPERGDIIVFVSEEDGGKLYVKRLIGLAGESIRINHGQVYINDVLLEEDYLNPVEDLKDYGEFLVPEGHYFFLGDNRNNSSDARKWDNPYIAESDLVGKAVLKYFPKIDILEHVDY